MPRWHDPTPLAEVTAEIHGWAQAVDSFGSSVRHGAVAIHPFIDENGRAGRLLLNLILVRLGYPPAIIFKRDRARYLAALDREDNGDPGALAELIARSVIDNLHRFVVSDIAGPARLVPLRSLAGRDVSYDALRQAARRGRLDAELASDGTWRSSRHAVREYLSNRNKQRRAD